MPSRRLALKVYLVLAESPSADHYSFLGAFFRAQAAWLWFRTIGQRSLSPPSCTLLALLCRASRSRHLQVHRPSSRAYSLSLRVSSSSICNLDPRARTRRLRLLTLPGLVSAFYLHARSWRLAGLSRPALRSRPLRRASAFVFALLLFRGAGTLQPLAFIAFAVVLSEAARALRYHALATNEQAIQACSQKKRSRRVPLASR